MKYSSEEQKPEKAKGQGTEQLYVNLLTSPL